MRSRSIVVLVAVLASLATPALVVAQPLTATSALVSVGSPADLPPRNGEFEPAVAVDANRPDVLAAGAIDTIDLQACPKNFDQPGCPFTPDVGISGVYFSFDSGHNWTQPTYTGLTQRDCGTVDVCQSHVGTIGTLPWYPESGLVSDADAAVAFGPRPVNGNFSWENGSRLYYANLAHRLSDRRPRKPFNAFESIAVSRVDNPTPDRIQDQNNWFHPVIAATRSSAATFEDKEQIWADNAESSPFFGNVYVCWTNFNGRSEPIMVSSSRDGGDTWTQKQVTDAGVNLPLGLRQACTMRTDSHGVVYLAYTQIAIGTPGIGHHMLVKSLDGGNHWTRPQPFQVMNDACYNVDPFQGRCTHEGPGGARNDLAAAPSLDVANGAPTGQDATDEIVDAWSDGRFGLNNEVSLLSYSTDRGRTWSEPAVASVSGDRSLYTAPAISPDGADLYLTLHGVPDSVPGRFRQSPIRPQRVLAYHDRGRGSTGRLDSAGRRAGGRRAGGDAVLRARVRVPR